MHEFHKPQPGFQLRVIGADDLPKETAGGCVLIAADAGMDAYIVARHAPRSGSRECQLEAALEAILDEIARLEAAAHVGSVTLATIKPLADLARMIDEGNRIRIPFGDRPATPAAHEGSGAFVSDIERDGPPSSLNLPRAERV